MSGCFGSAPQDRFMEAKLNLHLATQDDATEEQIERVADRKNAEFCGYNSDGEAEFKRDDGSLFIVIKWPEVEPDFDTDEETGRIYRSGWTWGDYEIEEVGE